MEASWTWGIAAIWLGLALVASLLSIRFKMSVALVEILVGVAAGNLAHLLDYYHVFGRHWELKPNEWIAFLAGFGSILLTFMAGAEIEPSLLRKSLKVTLSIGFASFLAPFVGAALYAHYVGWPGGRWDWNASLICGIALSTTSVAVVYAVMIETGLNETELGKLILAACFITDLGTVVALGACFANYNWTLALFAAVAVVVLWLAPGFVNWFFKRFATHMSEPGVKFVFFVLFALGSLAALANSEAVLPAYLVGLALAGVFARQRGNRAPLADHGVRASHALLLPQRRHEGLSSCTLGRIGAGDHPARSEDRRQGCGGLAAGPGVWFRATGEQLHHALDVHGPDLRDDQCPVRVGTRLYHPGAILGPRHRGDRQRRGADGDCPVVFSTRDWAGSRLPDRFARDIEPAVRQA